MRIEANPTQLNSYGMSLETIRKALQSANANQAEGFSLERRSEPLTINDTDQIFKAEEYEPLIVAGNRPASNAPGTSGTGGAAVRLGDIGQVEDSLEDMRNLAISNGKRSAIIAVFRQPGANMIATVDRIFAEVPRLQASISPSMHLGVSVDRTTTIRASVHDVEAALIISVILVILVVFVFLRDVWATLIPSVAVPLSLIGTFGVMYLLGLQPGQSFADGADDLHRVRGR